MKKRILVGIAMFIFAWLCEELGIFAEEVRARYGNKQKPDEPEPHRKEENEEGH